MEQEDADVESIILDALSKFHESASEDEGDARSYTRTKSEAAAKDAFEAEAEAKETPDKTSSLTKSIFQCVVAIALFFTILTLVIILSYTEVRKVEIVVTEAPRDICPNRQSILDGICDESVNSEECEFDGGDCCRQEKSTPSCSDCTCKLTTDREQIAKDFESESVFVMPATNGKGLFTKQEVTEVVTIKEVQSVDVCSRICMDSGTSSLVNGWRILTNVDTNEWRDFVNAWTYQGSNGLCTCLTILKSFCPLENSSHDSGDEPTLLPAANSLNSNLTYVQLTKIIPCGCLSNNVKLEMEHGGMEEKKLSRSSWHCQRECQSQTDCVSFSFDANMTSGSLRNGNCLLFVNDKTASGFLLNTTFESGWVSGPKVCTNSSSIWTIASSTTHQAIAEAPYNQGFSRVLVTGGVPFASDINATEVLDISNPDLLCNDGGDESRLNMPNIEYATGGLLIQQSIDGDVVNTALVVCGGTTMDMSSDHTEKTCIYTNHFGNATKTTVNGLTVGRDHAVSAVIDNGLTLWITGGRDKDDNLLDSSELIAFRGGDLVVPEVHSEEGPDLPEKLQGHCLVMVTKHGDHAVILGGKSSTVVENKTWHLTDIHQDDHQSWTQGPDMNVARVSHLCGMLKDTVTNQSVIIVAGGSIDYGAAGIASVEYLWIDQNRLENGSSLPIGLSSASSIVTPDSLSMVIIGGTTDVDIMNDRLYICSMSDGDCPWTLMEQRLSNLRANSVAMLVPDSMTSCIDKNFITFQVDYLEAISNASHFVVTTGRIRPGLYPTMSPVIDFQDPENNANGLSLASYPGSGMESGVGGLVRQDKTGSLAPLICGGKDLSLGGDVTDLCYKMDDDNPSMMIQAPVKLLQARHSASSVVIDNGQTLWITGGWQNQGPDQSLDTTEFVRLVPYPGTSQGPTMPTTSHSHCIMMANASHALLTLGDRVQHPHNRKETWFYNLKQNASTGSDWVPGPDLIAERQDHTCVVAYDKLLEKSVAIVAGGMEYSQPVSTVEFLWLDMNEEWIPGPDLPVATRGAVSILTPDQSSMIYLGGCSDCYNDNNHLSMGVCTIFGGTCTWLLMEQELPEATVWGVAMLLPPNFETMTEVIATIAYSGIMIVGGHAQALSSWKTDYFPTSKDEEGNWCDKDFGRYPISPWGPVGGILETGDGEMVVLVCGGLRFDSHPPLGYIPRPTPHCYTLGQEEDEDEEYVYYWLIEHEPIVELLHPRDFPASVVIDNGKTLWVTGGRDQSQTTELVTLVPTPSTREGPPLPAARWNHCLVLLTDKHAMLLSGSSSDPSTWVFDSILDYLDLEQPGEESSAWTLGPEMHIARIYATCGVLHDPDLDQNAVVVAGGQASMGVSIRSIELLWLTNGLTGSGAEGQEWTQSETNLCYDVDGAPGVVSPDKASLFVIGGQFQMESDSSSSYETVCKCTLASWTLSCGLMEDITLDYGPTNGLAVLVPDTMLAC